MQSWERSSGAKKLLRFGILTIVLPTGCAVAGSIVEGIVAGHMELEQAAALDRYFDNGAGMVLGVMLMLGALLCRYGAELAE